MNERVLKELIRARNTLKRKFRSIKMGEMNKYENLEDTFKPITLPLKQIINISEKKNKFLKIEKDDIKTENQDNANLLNNKPPFKFETSTPKKEMTSSLKFTNKRSPKKIVEATLKNDGYTTDDDDDNNDFYSQADNTSDDNDTKDFYPESENVSDVNLFDLSNLAKTKEIDNVYGPHKDVNGEWKFGDSKIKLEEDKIIIGNQKWALTPGLFTLMFYKVPKNYDKSELEIYKKILINTNAHRRDYTPNGQIKGSKAFKYKNIIGKLFKENKTGSGLMKLNSNKPNFIYWDDPNELVDRLRLLIASQNAGHNNHNNEIVSIIEELYEANIII